MTLRRSSTIQIATEIRTLPAGVQKVDLADALAHLVTERDAGHEALQAVRYEHVTSTLTDPLFDKATLTRRGID